MRLLESNNGIAVRDYFAHPDRAIPCMFVDVMETPEALVLKAQVPGTSKDRLEIHYEKDVLTIKAEVPAQEKPENGKFLLKERADGTVHRTFRLPFPVDAENAQAEYVDGILKLTLPKLESAKPRQIAIQ